MSFLFVFYVKKKKTNVELKIQDLPNNMIHQVKIKSLPQEWLWCETWCDDSSKKKAKTIDLVRSFETNDINENHVSSQIF